MIKLADSNLWKNQGLIGGEWRAADSGQTTEIRNPATAEVLGPVPTMGSAETRRAKPRAPHYPRGRRKPRVNARRSCASGSTS
jgi:succinate-semialdehyde dehydrogenase/glutarate-semialdehyde dehydrogenase